MLNVENKPSMLSVIMMCVVMLSVVAPFLQLQIMPYRNKLECRVLYIPARLELSQAEVMLHSNPTLARKF